MHDQASTPATTATPIAQGLKNHVPPKPRAPEEPHARYTRFDFNPNPNPNLDLHPHTRVTHCLTLTPSMTGRNISKKKKKRAPCAVEGWIFAWVWGRAVVLDGAFDVVFCEDCVLGGVAVVAWG